MPVVISLLNSYSGVGGGAGFVVGSQLLIVAVAMKELPIILTQV